jgi:hypothetical protein
MSLEKAYVAIDLEPEKSIGPKSPLHVTLTPPVILEEHIIPNVIGGLSDNLANFGLVEIKGEDEAQFGPSIKPVRVRKIAVNILLSKLHERSMDVMEEFIPNIDKAYARENWQPHSTVKGGIGLSKGETRIVDHVVLLGKQKGAWSRVAKIPLTV